MMCRMLAGIDDHKTATHKGDGSVGTYSIHPILFRPSSTGRVQSVCLCQHAPELITDDNNIQ